MLLHYDFDSCSYDMVTYLSILDIECNLNKKYVDIFDSKNVEYVYK